MKATISLAQGADSIILISVNNPESASIMLRNESLGVNDQGFMQVEKRVGMFKGKTADIQKLVKDLNLKEGDDFSQKVFPVKLVIREQHDPFYEGQEPKKNPTTDEVVTSGGAVVYRQTFVVEETSLLQDLRLPTDRETVTQTTARKVDFHTANQ